MSPRQEGQDKLGAAMWVVVSGSGWDGSNGCARIRPKGNSCAFGAATSSDLFGRYTLCLVPELILTKSYFVRDFAELMAMYVHPPRYSVAFGNEGSARVADGSRRATG